MSIPTDSLVLQIDEYEPVSGELEKRFYVLYDVKLETYVVRGKRSMSSWQTHSFYCDKVNDLVPFLNTIMNQKNSWNYRLYNFENMLVFSDDITFEYLDELAEDGFELAGYDNLVYSKSLLKKMLRLVRNVYNIY